jgi:hypothetical protein
MNMETDLELQRRESRRSRAEPQKWKWYVIAMLMLSVLYGIRRLRERSPSAAKVSPMLTPMARARLLDRRAQATARR